MDGCGGPEPAVSPRRRLTSREYQIAELVSYGLSNKGIAGLLGIPVDVVAHHLGSAYAKLGINSRSALASAVIAERSRIQAHKEDRGATPEPAMPAPPKRVNRIPAAARKPDPLTARTLPELEDHLRSLWAWVGRPSSRKLAARSGGAFSHATVNKLIHKHPRKPALKLEYVLGFVRACGADQAEQQRWAAAWRIATEIQDHQHQAG